MKLRQLTPGAKAELKQELEKEGLVDRWVDLRHGQTLFLDPKSQTG